MYKKKIFAAAMVTILLISIIIFACCMDNQITNKPNTGGYNPIDPIVPVEPDNDNKKYVLTHVSLNLRSEPNLSSNVLSVLDANETLPYVEKYNDNWYIANYNGEKVYLSANPAYTTLIDSKDLVVTDYTNIQALVDIRLRTSPSTSNSNNVVKTLSRFDIIPYLSKYDEYWYMGKYNNQTVYVSSNPSYTRLINDDELDNVDLRAMTIENIIAEGKKLLGTPYEYGAVRVLNYQGNETSYFTGNTYDCSSFMQYIFYKGAGIKLNADSRSQSLDGEMVSSISSLQRGDLIFMTSTARYYNTGLERIGHVGIYLGDGKLLHTFGSPGVIVDEFDAFWQDRFIHGRRML